MQLAIQQGNGRAGSSNIECLQNTFLQTTPLCWEYYYFLTEICLSSFQEITSPMASIPLVSGSLSGNASISLHLQLLLSLLTWILMANSPAGLPIHSQQSSQIFPFINKMWVKACHSSLLNLLMLHHFTQNASFTMCFEALGDVVLFPL